VRGGRVVGEEKRAYAKGAEVILVGRILPQPSEANRSAAEIANGK